MYIRGYKQDTSMVRGRYRESIGRVHRDVMFISRQNFSNSKFRNYLIGKNAYALQGAPVLMPLFNWDEGVP